jgi:hypothetical protein
VGAIRVKFGDIDKLESILEQGTSDAAAGQEEREYPIEFPNPNGGGSISAGQLKESDSTSIRDYTKPEPFAVFRLSAQTTRESFFPNRPYVDNSPFQNVVDIDLSEGVQSAGDQPYEMSIVRFEDGILQQGKNDEESFFFAGHGGENGTTRATFYEFPRLPLQSLAQFRHARLATSGIPPYSTYTVGESWGHPILAGDSVEGSNAGRDVYDHTYLSNAALWDNYFLSSLAEGYPNRNDSAEENRDAFFAGERDILNPRIAPLDGFAETDDAIDVLTDESEGWEKAARYIALRGGFNVNSTSKDAWVSILSSLRQSRIDTDTGQYETDENSAFPRQRRPSDEAVEASGSGFDDEEAKLLRWQGYRELTPDQIEGLAERIVDEVRKRGPFLSLSEFVNRRLESGEFGYRGAIEAAIQDDDSDINEVAKKDGRDIDSSDAQYHDWENTGAATGDKSSITGAPGAVSQGDILSVIGNYLTVRGDTFLIRCYGESRDRAGNVEAQAWCEATVQRVPQYVDSSTATGDEPEVKFVDLQSEANQNFGRKFRVTSFRWLSPEEV